MQNTQRVIVHNAQLAATLGLAANGEIDVEVCAGGVPTNREWRNRFADAATDGCVSLVSDAPTNGGDK